MKWKEVGFTELVSFMQGKVIDHVLPNAASFVDYPGDTSASRGVVMRDGSIFVIESKTWSSCTKGTSGAEEPEMWIGLEDNK